MTSRQTVTMGNATHIDNSNATLLEVRDLTIDYLTARGPARAVDNVSFSIRMGILNLMARLREERGLSYLYITHDLASARYLADETLVLYAGHLMEAASSEEVIGRPLHPYTRLLLSAVPDPGRRLAKQRVEARGEIPTVINPRPGCRFANRCPRVMAVCKEQTPALIEVRTGHRVRCHLYPAATA